MRTIVSHRRFRKIVLVPIALLLAMGVFAVSTQVAHAAPLPQTAFVVNRVSRDVTPIDVAAGVAGVPIPVGIDPYGIAITPDGATAYVTNYDGHNVTPIDVATGVPGAPIAVGVSPYGIAITPDGATAYVANVSDNSVTPIDLVTDTPGTPIAVGNGPYNIAITPDGVTAYVTAFYEPHVGADRCRHEHRRRPDPSSGLRVRRRDHSR